MKTSPKNFGRLGLVFWIKPPYSYPMLTFEKYHGTGNDFILIEVGETSPEQLARTWKNQAIRLCDRHTGIGADGLLLISKPDNRYQMTVINADGSMPEMCGNGLRCVAQYLKDHDLVTDSPFEIITQAGVLSPSFVDDQIMIDMGAPRLDPKDSGLLVSRETPTLDCPVAVNGRPYALSVVSMGNPHAVIEVPDLHAVPFSVDGPALSTHPDFTQGVNVEFVAHRSRSEMDLIVWERGAGPTMACGTGACAAVVAGVLRGQLDREVVVTLPGGDLTIRWDADSGHVWMTGPAERVFSGTL